MIDNNLLQGIVTAVISSVAGAIVVFILPYIAKLAARTINIWLTGIILVVLVVGLLYGASLEKISFGWVLGGLAIIIFAYAIYKRYFDFPFRKWRVTNNRPTDNIATKEQKHNPGLLGLHSGLDAMPIDKTWVFKAKQRDVWAVFGPYIKSLDKGKYKAIFKLKVMVGTDNADGGELTGDLQNPIGLVKDKQNREMPKIEIVEIRVASYNKNWADTTHGEPKLLDTHFFKKANKYQKFTIEFSLDALANRVEFAVISKGNGHIVVLDYIKLSRRLF